MQLEVRHLHIISTISELGSISAAATEIGIDQPNLSRQLKRIEGELGQRIFERSDSGVVATSFGQTVIRKIREIIHLLNSIDQPKPERHPTNLVVATNGPSIEPIINKMSGSQQIERVSTHAASENEAISMVKRGFADLFFCIHWPHVDFDLGDLHRKTILTEEMRVMVAKSSRASTEEEIDLPSLSDIGWIVRPELPTTAEECRRFGFDPIIACTTTDHGRYLDLVGCGAAVCFSSAVPHLNESVTTVRYRNASEISWEIIYHPLRGVEGFTEELSKTICSIYESRLKKVSD
ncbi:LysR family transcriptional regulator [Lentzea sp. HUAS12]|uniref:LysR family transcriptional regulator n=1 Tax=Lentzea sp. HUAS12 TaxID=2951806 RepID=UPI00209D5594|nr:LysR family transcriptional regulator [Lentzea sp. HUAS12]USX55158.1 LysR family transcriptional regulator [Lentzea sp. HUAS12]